VLLVHCFGLHTNCIADDIRAAIQLKYSFVLFTENVYAI
jgi:hypothetical protein